MSYAQILGETIVLLCDVEAFFLRARMAGRTVFFRAIFFERRLPFVFSGR